MSDARDALLDAGLVAFRANGYDATGVKDVTDAACVPKGSFHYHFPDGKEAFAAAVVDAYARATTEYGQAELGDTSIPPLTRLRRYFEQLIPLYERDMGCGQGCLLGNFSAEVADRSEAIRTRVQAAFAAWQGQLHATLAEVAETGGLPLGLDPDQAAAFLIDAWEGALVRMKAEKSVAPLRRFLDVAFDRVLRP